MLYNEDLELSEEDGNVEEEDPEMTVQLISVDCP